MSAMTCPGSADKVAASIRRISENLKAESGLLGRLSRSLQFVVAAILLGQSDNARDFFKEVKRVRAMFREEGIRRAAIYETMTVLILRMQAKQKPIEKKAVKRLKDIYEGMKHHHWWITGPEDLPACAILTRQDASAEQIAQKSEDIYQALAKQKHTKGDALQTAANILSMVPDSPAKIAKRYCDLGEGFKKSGVSIWQTDYDELAILTFLDHPTKRIVDRVLDHRETMKTLNPKPDRLLTFSLAVSTTFLELAQVDRKLKSVVDTKAMVDMQAIIQAQQAAMVAVAAAAGAASSSSASS